MKVNRTLALLVVLFGLAVRSVAQAGDSNTYLAHTLASRIIVSEPETVAFALTDWAESRSGYFVRRSLERVSLRVPATALPALRERLEELSFTVVSYDPAATDVRQELRSVEVGISSRRESLDDILAFLDDSDVVETLAFEREMTAILRELENLEGRRRELVHRAAFARIEISLSSRQPELPVYVPSSFDWINTMGLDRFTWETY